MLAHAAVIALLFKPDECMHAPLNEVLHLHQQQHCSCNKPMWPCRPAGLCQNAPFTGLQCSSPSAYLLTFSGLADEESKAGGQGSGHPDSQVRRRRCLPTAEEQCQAPHWGRKGVKELVCATEMPDDRPSRSLSHCYSRFKFGAALDVLRNC